MADGLRAELAAGVPAESIADAVRALRESAERLSLALEASNLGDWSWDAASDLVTFSERGGEIFGLPPGPCMTWSAMRERLHEEDRERARLAVEEAIAGRGNYDVEYRLILPDGSLRWVSAKGRARYGVSGEVLGMLGVVQDVTARRQAEEALREADRRKDQFLAMLAHELRNPLAPVRNALQILRTIGSGEPRLQAACAMIDRQVTHMARLVDDLLDVSRISRGKILLRQEELDLVGLVRASAEDHRALLDAAGLTLHLEVPPEPVWVQGDATRLSQILDNLLQNAQKFTHPGGRVSLRLHADSAAGAAEIAVTDSGIGIEPEILPHLFSPFSQADQSLDRSRGGLGLGLALVKGLVKLHGGTVEAASEGRGSGSRFTVRLPLAPGGGSASETPDDAIEPPERSLLVLVIEDNRDAADSLQMLLDLSGFRAEVAYSGQEGVEAARQLQPDVVLCDIGLPAGLDGYAVGRLLREELPGAHLFALTGYGREEDRRRTLEAGFDRHLTKPVNPPELIRLLGELSSG